MSEDPNSRVEEILQNLLGESYDLDNPRSRVEDILIKLINSSSNFGKPQSRVEALLEELSLGKPAKLQTLQIFENNRFYYPDTGYDGFSSVEVYLDVGYDHGSYVTGTINNPFGSISYEQGFPVFFNSLETWWNMLYVRSVMDLDGTSLGLGSGTALLLPQSNASGNVIMATGGFIDGSSYMVVTILWGENGLISAELAQDGSITDVSPYADLITTYLYYPKKGL